MKHDLKGQIFGKLKVIKEAPKLNGRVRWECLCECGAVREVLPQHLKSGRTKSCGCHNKETQRQRFIKQNTTHGMSHRRVLFDCWHGIRNRCLNEQCPSYEGYGSRGITICDEWKDDLPAFISYVDEVLGEKPSSSHSLDRIDNDGNYEPGNVRWADAITQANNRRPKKLNNN